MQKSIEIEIDTRRPVKWAWPGGYPVYYLIEDFSAPFDRCAISCAACIPQYLGAGDVVTAADINREDPEMFCELCNAHIESAYAEKETI